MTRTCGHTTFTPVPGCEVCQEDLKPLGELLREWLILQIPTASN